MSKLLERLLREREEKIQRAKEREAKKKEREKQRQKEIKEKQRARKRRKYNNKVYHKRRQAELERHRLMGDKKGWHMVIITKNRKKIKNLGHSWWASVSYERYEEALKENRESVKFPVGITETSEKRQKQGERSAKVNYEILLVRKIDEESGTSNIASFRDDDGRFVEHYFANRSDYLILKRDEWYVEETFNVYGYNPSTDRKDYTFIKENIISSATEESSKRVMMYKNKLVVIKDDMDIDFVSCKTSGQCEALYDKLEEEVKEPGVLFQGKAGGDIVTWVMNLIEAKTGWTRTAIKRQFKL